MQIQQLDTNQLPLAVKFFKEARYSAKVSKQDRVFVFRENETSTSRIIAAVRLSKLDSYTLLRSMVVHPSYRSKGVGSEFLRDLEPHLDNGDCWCFPFARLKSFYAQAGFVNVDISDAPNCIANKFNQYRANGKALIIMRRKKC